MKCILVDLDGTLADCTHRLHFVREDMNEGLTKFKKDWKGFFDNMYNDAVNASLNEVLVALRQNHMIIFVTARPSNYYGVTARWLYEKAGWSKTSYQIYMRPAGDFREDSIVKKEILDKIIEEGHEILVVFDDRSSVVKMWRDNNVFCCQVADHNF
jgi:hypothetical protein